jgi:hypothetical protein
MLTLAALRYRSILSCHGGPIRRLETGVFPFFGREVMQANAWLDPEHRPRQALHLYSDADGTGTHRSVAVARHMAISEALERWAFHAIVHSERAAEFGFDVDPTSNGMSALPGFRRRTARRKALLEAVERFCLLAWWEGRAVGHPRETDWPGVSAVAIEGPFGGVTVIAHGPNRWGGYAYGHAAETSFGAACEKAVIELARHEQVLRAHQLATAGGKPRAVTDLFERRALFFASPEGHAVFRQRLLSPARSAIPRPVLTCDREIPGPWSKYATVWRVGLQPLSDGYLQDDERYFFW